MLSAFNDVKSTEKMDIWFYYIVYHKIIPNFSFSFTRFLDKECWCKTNLHKMSLLLVVICMQAE